MPWRAATAAVTSDSRELVVVLNGRQRRGSVVGPIRYSDGFVFRQWGRATEGVIS